MGNYFLMSTRFNKQEASDFGLLQTEESDLAINPADHSIWRKCALYDYGWGRENGYYKTPILAYDGLLELVLFSRHEDDVYGAAAIILDEYPNELLETCESMSSCHKRTSEFKKISSVFRLHLGINYSPIIGKTLEEIEKDACRWKAISTAAKEKNTRWCFCDIIHVITVKLSPTFIK